MASYTGGFECTRQAYRLRTGDRISSVPFASSGRPDEVTTPLGNRRRWIPGCQFPMDLAAVPAGRSCSRPGAGCAVDPSPAAAASGCGVSIILSCSANPATKPAAAMQSICGVRRIRCSVRLTQLQFVQPYFDLGRVLRRVYVYSHSLANATDSDD